MGVGWVKRMERRSPARPRNENKLVGLKESAKEEVAKGADAAWTHADLVRSSLGI